MGYLLEFSQYFAEGMIKIGKRLDNLITLPGSFQGGGNRFMNGQGEVATTVQHEYRGYGIVIQTISDGNSWKARVHYYLLKSDPRKVFNLLTPDRFKTKDEAFDYGLKTGKMVIDKQLLELSKK